MQYLTRWRLTIAAQRLRDERVNLARLAEDSGYESEAAFNRAFKRALGTTPGQRLAGLKVTRLDRSQPSRAQKLLRPVAAALNLLTFGVGFLWMARSPRHQAVHDIITRTLVLRR